MEDIIYFVFFAIMVLICAYSIFNYFERLYPYPTNIQALLILLVCIIVPFIIHLIVLFGLLTIWFVPMWFIYLIHIGFTFCIYCSCK